MRSSSRRRLRSLRRSCGREHLLAHNREKLRALQPELFAARSWTKFLRENGYRLGALNEDVEYWKRHFAEHLRTGALEPAVVVSAAPLLVAAYAGELDCVALLRFDAKFAQRHPLAAGARLLASNACLEWNFWLPEDLKPGPRASGKYRNFAPLIADALTQNLTKDLTELEGKIRRATAERQEGAFYIRTRIDRMETGQITAYGDGLYMPVHMTGAADVVYRPQR